MQTLTEMLAQRELAYNEFLREQHKKYSEGRELFLLVKGFEGRFKGISVNFYGSGWTTVHVSVKSLKDEVLVELLTAIVATGVEAHKTQDFNGYRKYPFGIGEQLDVYATLNLTDNTCQVVETEKVIPEQRETVYAIVCN